MSCSGNELLCTEPSSSPLSLLRKTFGLDVSSALRELNANEGVLNLTGHMSSPSDDFSFKVTLNRASFVYIDHNMLLITMLLSLDRPSSMSVSMLLVNMLCNLMYDKDLM